MQISDRRGPGLRAKLRGESGLTMELLLVSLLLLGALAFVFTRSGLSLFTIGLFVIALIALVPEVIDLVLTHYATPPAGSDVGKSGGQFGWTKGLTRGTIALVALAIFAVALFRLLDAQCASTPIPAITTGSATPAGASGSGSAGGGESQSAGPTTDQACKDNSQAISTMLGAIIALVSAVSTFYFASRGSDDQSTTPAGGGAVAGAPVGTAPVKTPPAVRLLDPLPEGEGARLRGAVTPGGDMTFYRFEFGETIEYSTWFPVHEVQPSEQEREVMSELPILGVHYRLVAWNDGGIAATEDREWPSPP